MRCKNNTFNLLFHFWMQIFMNYIKERNVCQMFLLSWLWLFLLRLRRYFIKNGLNLLQNLLWYGWCITFIISQGETDGCDRFVERFEFIKSLLILFLYFGIANSVEKELNDVIMIRVLNFGLCILHLRDIDHLHILNINSFYDCVEFKKFLNYK